MNMSAGVHVQNDLDWSKTTFLVVDSKAMYRDMVQTALLGAGAKSVKHANSVEKAIESLTRYGQEISCVITEWDMAPVGGLELLRKIRARALPKTSPRTAVIILTARADAAIVKAAMAMDVNGFAVAPLSFEKLVKTVAHGLQRTWMLQQPAQYLALPGVDTSQPDPSKAFTAQPAAAITNAGVGVGPGTAPSRPANTPVTANKPTPRRSEQLKNVHMCILSEVRPGQVLARDLRDKDGHLLLSAGAVLKPTLIDRLRNVAEGHADSYHVWIGDRDETQH